MTTENLTLLYTAKFKTKIYGERTFDTSIIIRTPSITLYDIKINLEFPQIKTFDILFELVREIDLTEKDIINFKKSENRTIYQFTKKDVETNKNVLVSIDNNLTSILNISKYTKIPLGDLQNIKNIHYTDGLISVPTSKNYILILTKNNDIIVSSNIYDSFWYIKDKNTNRILYKLYDINTLSEREFINKLLSIFGDKIYFEFSFFQKDVYTLSFSFNENYFDVFLDKRKLKNGKNIYSYTGFHSIRVYPKSNNITLSENENIISCKNVNINNDYYPLNGYTLLNSIKIGFPLPNYGEYPQYLSFLLQNNNLLIKNITDLIKYMFFKDTPKLFLKKTLTSEEFTKLDIIENNINWEIEGFTYNTTNNELETLKILKLGSESYENLGYKNPFFLKEFTFTEMLNNLTLFKDWDETKLSISDIYLDFSKTEDFKNIKNFRIKIPFKFTKIDNNGNIIKDNEPYSKFENFFNQTFLVVYLSLIPNLEKYIIDNPNFSQDSQNTNIFDFIFDNYIRNNLPKISFGIELRNSTDNSLYKTIYLKKEHYYIYDRYNFKLSSDKEVKNTYLTLSENNLNNTKTLNFLIFLKLPKLTEFLTQYEIENDNVYVSSFFLQLNNFDPNLFLVEQLLFTRYNNDLVYIYNPKNKSFFKFNDFGLNVLINYIKENSLPSKQDFLNTITYIENNFKDEFTNITKGIFNPQIIYTLTTEYKSIIYTSEFITISKIIQDTSTIYNIYSKLYGTNIVYKGTFVI